MFVHKIKSEGIAHLSYLIGDQDQAAVIDPRRDCEIYINKARQEGCRITHIFETHRNEDLVSGAARLSAMTGATVYHGPHADGEVSYAETTSEGDSYTLGDLRIVVLETPGHTEDSISLVLYDDNFGESAVAVFTGDALFVGDVGRTDFYPDRAAEVAGKLFDSLQKLFKLGDQTIIHPAHGAGSVCGDNMANREFSTLGYERLNNPMARMSDRDKFIAAKLDEHHNQPPYFRLMERLNLEGSLLDESALLQPPVLSIKAFEEICHTMTVVDVRGVTDFLGAHTPGALCIPEGMLPAFAGWLLDHEDNLLLVADGLPQARKSLEHLYRIGYDRVQGMMVTPIPGWASSARAFRNLAAVDAEEVARRVESNASNWALLDVREEDEVLEGRLPGAIHAFVGELPDGLETLDREQTVTTMCASGARATIAASILLRQGFSKVDVFLGSMGAWKGSGRDTRS